MDSALKIALPPSYPGVKVYYQVFQNVSVLTGSSKIDQVIGQVESELRSKYTLDSITENPEIKYWTSLYAKMGVDVRKHKPACLSIAERILRGRNIPRINSLVDIANLVMAKHLHPVGAFDFDQIRGNILLRLSEPGERYVALFEKEPTSVPPGEIVYADADGIFSRYSKDADRTKITSNTIRVLYVVDGTPQTENSMLETAARYLSELVSFLNPHAVLDEGSSLVCT